MKTIQHKHHMEKKIKISANLAKYRHGRLYITLDEFIEAVEEADTWDFIDGEVDDTLKAVGLDYSQHRPDTMWEDFLEAAKIYQ